MTLEINFFEEFPEEGELQRAELVDFRSTVFIAASSVDAYDEYKAELADINPELEPGYWPVLENSYWISPFADTDELTELFEEIRSFEDPVCLDLELPLLEPSLFFQNISRVRTNKTLISNFIQETETEIVTAEYPPAPILSSLYGALGISYESEQFGHTRCLMYYTSMVPDAVDRRLATYVERTARTDADVAVGLGTIASGVLGDESILTPEGLEQDLQRMVDADIEAVSIFRLGGLDEEYVDVLGQFAD